MPSVHIAIAYYSGYGHTLEIAKAVRDGIESVAGARADMVDVAAMTDAKWEILDAGDAIIFGTPTYMGSASGAFHAFAEATSKRWMTQQWLDNVPILSSHKATVGRRRIFLALHLQFSSAPQGLLV